MLSIEWKNIWKNKFMVIVLIAIVLIPSIYAVGFLKSMWDPYGRIKDLPVAVINEDKSVKYQGKMLSVGAKLKTNLSNSDAMKFSFPSKKAAKQGLANGKYYMVMTIPENFSENATTLLDSHPKKMLVHYTTSSGHSFIAGKFSKSAAESIASSISTQVTKSYAKTLFKQIKTLGNGMGTAADGNKKLVDGTEQLQTGNQTISTNLKTLASSSLTFSNGTNTLTDGLSQYFSGVNQLDTGSSKLTSGLGQLGSQIPTLSTGVSQLSAGSSSLNSGLKQYTSGVNQLSSGSIALATGVSDYTKGTDDAYKGSQKVSTGLAEMNQALNSNDAKNKIAKLQTGLKQFQVGLNQLKESLDNSNQSSEQITELTNTMSSLGTNVATVSSYITGTKEKIESVAKKQNLTDTQINALETALLPTNDINNALKSATSNLSNLQTNLTSLIKASDNSMSELKSAVNMLNTNYGTGDNAQTLYGGVTAMITSLNQVGSSTTKLSDGAAQLTDGLSQLSNQSQKLVSGSSNLKEGTQQLSQNSDKLNIGSEKLNNGLSSVNEKMPTFGTAVSQLSTGSSQLTSGLDKLVANNSKLLSGSSQLASGATKIAAGSSKLADGSTKLGDGLTKVKDGNQTLANKLSQANAAVNQVNANQLTYKQLANPASTKHVEKDKVPNNGTAMAPYMLSVALFVGAVAFNLMFDLVTPLRYPKKGISWWASKMSVLYPFAFVQASIMYLIVITTIGIKPVHYIATFGVLILVSFTFINVVTALNLWFGKVGSFLAMILMVIQLGGSAGTYPIQLSNGFFEAINPYLPMTYSVNALRETLMIGGSSRSDVVVMLGIFVVFTLIMIAFYLLKQLKVKRINYKQK
ncbi:YhgE/Pip family protein [Leuconostoc pseudomesenteroides]|uniref:YhgE/Pip family protein n=1 Tax=Leuconostoc pseudomesenteroides TaxID=33968 RepID=UPI0040360F24